jgi:hypothetical protein
VPLAKTAKIPLDGGRKTQCDRQFHLDRSEHLSDLVVQFAGDLAPLFFLRGNQLGGEVLEIARMLNVFGALPSNAVLEGSPAGGRSSAVRRRVETGPKSAIVTGSVLIR